MSSKKAPAVTHPKFEMRSGRPSSHTLKLGEICTQPLKDQIFPDEWLALKYLKDHCELCTKYNDEFLFACLFARKMDIGRTIELVERSWKWRSDHGFEEIPKTADLVWDYGKMQVFIPGTRTKSGHGITYLFAGRMEPAKTDLQETVKWIVWYYHVGQFYSGMDVVRNGVYLVNDNAEYGWKNFDLTYLRTISDLFQNNFPYRLRRVAIVNSGFLVKAITALIAPFMKQKVLDRFKISSYDDLAAEIDKTSLWEYYGGSARYSIDESLATLKAFGKWFEEQHDHSGKINSTRSRAGTLKKTGRVTNFRSDKGENGDNDEAVVLEAEDV